MNNNNPNYYISKQSQEALTVLSEVARTIDYNQINQLVATLGQLYVDAVQVSNQINANIIRSMSNYYHINQQVMDALAMLDKSLQQTYSVDLEQVIDQECSNNHIDERFDAFDTFATLKIRPTRIEFKGKKFYVKSDTAVNQVNNQKFFHLVISKIKDQDLLADYIATSVFEVIRFALICFLTDTIDMSDFVSIIQAITVYINSLYN